MSVYSQMIRIRFMGVFRPLFISWMITDRCNLKCSACSRNSGRTGDSPKQVADRIVEIAARESVFKINLTGGEPLIHPGIGSIIERLHNSNIKVTMNTNGVYAADRIALLKPVNGVNVSLDGRPETHDAYRGSGAYGAAVAAVETLRGAGVPVKVTCSISSAAGLEDIRSVLETAGRLDVPVVFQPGQLFILGSRLPNPAAPAPSDFGDLLEYVISFKRKHPAAILNSLQGLSHLAKLPADARLFCGAGRFFCRIDPAGNVFACSNSLGPESPAGNILSSSLSDLFAGYRHPPCTQCWCADRVEANLIFGLNPGAVTNYMLHRARFNL